MGGRGDGWPIGGGVAGRQTGSKALVVIAAQADWAGHLADSDAGACGRLGRAEFVRVLDTPQKHASILRSFCTASEGNPFALSSRYRFFRPLWRKGRFSLTSVCPSLLHLSTGNSGNTAVETKFACTELLHCGARNGSMGWLQDIRFAFRLLLKSPGFTLVVVAALAAGIGVNTAVFTMVNAVLFRGLPFERPDEIMHLTSNDLPKGREDIGASYPDFADWRAQTKSLEGLAAFSPFGANLTDAPAGPDRFAGARLTANVFTAIGQKPMLGRDFLASEAQPGAQPVVILGYTVWKNRYGGDPKILGKIVRLNEVATTVIGVMPEGMKFPVTEDLWTPLVATGSAEKRDSRNMQVFGRLAPGASLASARAEMDLVAKRLEKEYGATNKGVGIVIRPYNDVFNGGQIRTIFLAMLGAVGFVLLIACANVANLQLSRALARLREVSIRTALGASRWRVVRQLLVESVLLGVMGGVVGLGLAMVGVRAFDAAVANVGKPYWVKFEMDFQVFSYLAIVCIGAGIVSGLLPAIAATKVDLNTSLKEGGRGSGRGARGQWMSGVLVTAEFALSMILLIGAGLMIRSLLSTYDVVARFDLDHTLVGRVVMPESKWKKTAERAAFWDGLMPRLKSIPGVRRVALASNIPGTGAAGWNVEVEGRPVAEKDPKMSSSGLTVSPGYFEAMGISLQRGRDFNDADGLQGKEALIVNTRFVARFFPTEDPLGRKVRIIGEKPGPWLTIIGVSEDIAQDPQRVEMDAVGYVPYRQAPFNRAMIVARTPLAVTGVVSETRKVLFAFEPEMPLVQAQSLREFYAQSRWPFRVFGTLFVVFAGIALVLAGVGIFSVVAYNVGRRTQEIGVRIALGASTMNILGIVLRRGMVQLAIGTAIGLAGALAVTTVLKSVLHKVSPKDPTTFVVVTAVLLLVGMVACWLPARRAARVDPLVALRYE